MIFNRSRKFDFLPEVGLNTNEKIQVSESIKLLGVTISSDLKWHDNTKFNKQKRKFQTMAIKKD